MDARERRRRKVKGGGISNMLGQMHGPTVVCHSWRFRSFRYLFSLNVSSSLRVPLPFYLRLYPAISALGTLSFSSCVSRVCHPRGAPLDRLFFPLSRVIIVSTVACTQYSQFMIAWEYFLLRYAAVPFVEKFTFYERAFLLFIMHR